MRGISGAVAAVGVCLVALVPQPGRADAALAEASGNWAGPGGGGFWFRATLDGVGDSATLRIWNDSAAVPKGGAPQLEVPGFALTAFATEVRLEVVEGAQGSILQVVTAFADEEGEGREVVQVQYLDTQFTVIGFYGRTEMADPSGATFVMECEVDAWNARVTVDGVTSDLPPMDVEALNASLWSAGAAFDRGWCPRP